MKTTVGLPVVVVLLVMGCSTTQQVAVKEEPGICAFLGEACHQLQPGAKGEAVLRWVDPKNDPTQYQGDTGGGRFLRHGRVQGLACRSRAAHGPFPASLTNALATKYQVVDQARAWNHAAPGRPSGCRGGDAGVAVGLDGDPAGASARHRLLRRIREISLRWRRTGGVQGHRRGDRPGPRSGGGSACGRRTIQTAAQWQWGTPRT